MSGKPLAVLGCAGLIACVAIADIKHPSHHKVFDTGPVAVPVAIGSSLGASAEPDWRPAPASQVVVPQTTTTSPHPIAVTGYAACWVKYHNHTRSKPC